jgi:hypothetical protein
VTEECQNGLELVSILRLRRLFPGPGQGSGSRFSYGSGANVDSKSFYLYNVDREKHTGVGVLGATRQRMAFLAAIEGNTLEFMRGEAVGSI